MEGLKGLIIDTLPINNILSGLKTWEMRSTATKKRGLVALIRKSSGSIVGVAEIVDSIGPLSREDMLANPTKHMIAPERILSGAIDKWKYAWIISRARTLPNVVRYQHPPGAVIWVNLSAGEEEVVRSQLEPIY